MERISRRNGLKMLLGVGSATVLSACDGAFPPYQNRSTEPRPTPLPNKEQEIHPEHLSHVLDALRKSNVPLYKMSADQIEFLKATMTKPFEYPNWITNNSVPLKIYTNTSEASESGFSAKYGNNQFKYSINNGPFKVHPKLEYAQFGTLKLGVPRVVQAGGNLVEGIYLAEAHLTNMIQIGFSKDFFDLMSPRIVRFLDLDDKPIIDSTLQREIGAAFFFGQAKDCLYDICNAVEGLPKFLVSEPIDYLRSSKILPNNSSVDRAFSPELNKISQILKNEPTFANIIRSLADDWVKSGKLIPPSDISAKTFSDAILGRIRRYQMQGQ